MEREEQFWLWTAGGLGLYGAILLWLNGIRVRKPEYWVKKGWRRGRRGKPLTLQDGLTCARLTKGKRTALEQLETCEVWMTAGHEAGARGDRWERGYRALKRVRGDSLGSMTQEGAVQLMKFLSGVASDLGIGRDAYVVGGAVRNFLLGRGVKDLDLVIDSVRAGMDSEEFARAIAAKIPVSTTLKTNQYGVAILHINGDFFLGGENLKGEDIEIANARREWYGEKAGKGYKPHKVEAATIEEDVARREFTFNTLLWQLAELAEGPDKAEILDITGCGLKDLRAGEMRCPSDPDVTFQDDPTRLLRVVKFSTKYGFDVPPETRAAIARNASQIKNAPHEAISTLLLDVLLKDKKLARKSLRQLKDLGLLKPVREMYREIPAFRSALNNWSKNKEVQLMFQLADIGFPVGPGVEFLDASQQAKFRAAVATMKKGEPEKYLERLRQPGKAWQDKAFLPELMAQHGISGAEVRSFAQFITQLARRFMLNDPSMAFNPVRLRSAIREIVVGGHVPEGVR
jgi:tRNA nucleotidyltransferase/poly(A) polymerase